MTEINEGSSKSISNGRIDAEIHGTLRTATNGKLLKEKDGGKRPQNLPQSENPSTESKDSASNISVTSVLKGTEGNQGTNMGCNNTRTVVEQVNRESEKPITNLPDQKESEKRLPTNIGVTGDEQLASKTSCVDGHNSTGDTVFCDQTDTVQLDRISNSDSGLNRSRNTSRTSESTNSDTEKCLVPSESASESTEKILSNRNIESSDVTDVEETGDDGNVESSGVEGLWISRPHSLSLPKPLQLSDRQRFKGGKCVVYDETSSDDQVSVDSDLSSFGSSLHGTVMRKGEMIEFVADNLQEKIRGSRESSSMGSRTSSIRSISSVNSISSYTSSLATSVSGMSRSPSSLVQTSPDAIPPIDPQAVLDLESHAKVVADRVDLMMGNLKANLCKMSAITVGTLDAYKHSVESTCDAVDASIKSMYTLMAKCEELSSAVNPVYQLADQIKEIKRLLDLFESKVETKTT